ncbi:hypothetical protein A2U01_0100814, partial [Trifolium medium]|nr:hypothetical protein [Trifolium medium]
MASKIISTSSNHFTAPSGLYPPVKVGGLCLIKRSNLASSSRP